MTPELASHFTLHLVDLPGYGRSSGFGALSLEEMAQQVLSQAPEQAIWLGWSLGGLVAIRLPCNTPDAYRRWSPWRPHPVLAPMATGPIKAEVLSGFQQQLSEDFQRTVERFLALQTLGTESARRMPGR